MKKYRIGNFARFLGVQAGHLKHYSKSMLLTPEYAENGYRFYSFRDAPIMVHLMFLRAFGFNLKDSEAIMKAEDYREVSSHIAVQRRVIEQEILRRQASLEILDEIDETYSMAAAHRGEVRHCPPMFVHINGDRHGFLEAEELTEITAEFSSNMPLVNSCAVLNYEKTPDNELMWGMCIDAGLSERFGVNTSGCTLIPERDCFVYSIYADGEYGTVTLRELFSEAFDRMAYAGLKPGKNIIAKSFLQSNYKKHNILLFRLLIPIESRQEPNRTE